VAPGKLDVVDFPVMLAHRYGIHNVEEQQFHFLSMERSYCEKFHGWLQKAKSRLVDMPLDMIDQGRTWGDDLTPIIDALRTLRDLWRAGRTLPSSWKSGDPASLSTRSRR
jgi:hypothetical protein